MPIPFLSRRRLMTLAGASLLALPALAEDADPVRRPVRAARKPVAARPTPPAAPAAAAPHEDGPPAVTPEAAMTRLMAGNARYVESHAFNPHRDAGRRIEVATGQRPFATILACADSRVAPEIIFDQGLGDLFVVRVAGNVVDDALLASLEYSVIHLGSTLIMALGHERCGAVKATIDALEGRGSPEDAGTRIGALASLISPAVRAVPAGTADKLDAAVTLNASNAAAEIFAGSKPLRTRVLEGRLKIVSARYDLDDGVVTPAKSGMA